MNIKELILHFRQLASMQRDIAAVTKDVTVRNVMLSCAESNSMYADIIEKGMKCEISS